jgi:heterodisulfide reductase subunit C
MTTKKPASPEMQNILERAAKELAEAMQKEGVAFEEVARIDERILEMVRKIGHQTTEEVIKKKAVEIQKKAGVKTHRKSIIECENIFGKIEINSPYLWMKN